MQQPDLFSSSTEGRSAVTESNQRPSPESGPSSGGPPRQKRSAAQRFGRALMAAEFLSAIMVRIFVGVIVLVLPWSPLWDNNHLLQDLPHVAEFFSLGATRGVISGLGLLNLWVAVEETLHRSQRHT